MQKDDIIKIFQEFAKAFEQKISSDFFIKLQYEIENMNEVVSVQIEVKDGLVHIYDEEVIEPEDIFVMSVDTLYKLYYHELTPLTALANEPDESGKMISLIEPKYKNEERLIYLSGNNKEKAIEFAKRLHKMDDFFNRDAVYVAKVKSGCRRKLHKVDAIGLYNDFSKGLLHVFFSIKKGEILQEPPIECSIYVLQGCGTIEYGQEHIEIIENEYYHICPNHAIKIMNMQDEELNLLYLGQR